MPLLVRSGRTIIVPDVVGKAEEEATQVIKEASLKPFIQDRRFDPVIEKGHIVIQEPLPGKRVKGGRTINLVVSEGIEKVTLPYILGLELEKAKQILGKYDMEISAIESTFSDSIAEGKIVSSTPNPGEEVPKGSKITIKISLGKSITVPDFTGLKLEEARRLIKEKGLTMGQVKEIEGSGETGAVLMQSPLAGTTARPADSVNLMVVKSK